MNDPVKLILALESKNKTKRSTQLSHLLKEMMCTKDNVSCPHAMTQSDQAGPADQEPVYHQKHDLLTHTSLQCIVMPPSSLLDVDASIVLG